jgi:opacity protein-like surface antigen
MGHKNPVNKRTLLVLLIALAAVASAPGARAQTDTTATAARSHWGTLKVHILYTWPMGDSHVEAFNDCDGTILDFLDFSSSINVNETLGGFVGFEYVLAHRYGIEGTLLFWRNVVDLEFEASGFTISGTPSFIMPILGFNYHFFKGKKTDLYAGPMFGLGILATGWGYEDLKVGKDVALGLNLALDYYVDESWSFGTSLKYLDFGELDFSIFPPGFEGIICNNGLFGIGDMSILSVTLGVGYKF